MDLGSKATRRPVLVPECHLRDSKLFEDSFFDDHSRYRPALRDVASKTVQVARAGFFFGWIGDGSTHLTAYDLDDGFWYVFHEDPEVDTWLLAIVPSTCAGKGFRDAQCQGLREVYTDVLPRSLTAKGMDESWFIRQLMELAAPWESEWWGAVESSRDDCGVSSQCLTWWLRGVETDPQGEASSPGLTDGPESDSFDTWIDRVSVRWRGTGEILTREEARRLRLVCQHLVHVGA